MPGKISFKLLCLLIGPIINISTNSHGNIATGNGFSELGNHSENAATFQSQTARVSDNGSLKQGIPTEIKFLLGARNLPAMDSGNGAPDPFAVLSGATGNQRSQTLDNNFNPDWPDVFKVIHRPGQDQWINIEIRDHDPFAFDDSIGMAKVYVGSLLADCSESFYPIRNSQAERGKLVVYRPCVPTMPTTTSTTPSSEAPSTRTPTWWTTRRTTTTGRTTTYYWSAANSNATYFLNYIMLSLGFLFGRFCNVS